MNEPDHELPRDIKDAKPAGMTFPQGLGGSVPPAPARNAVPGTTRVVYIGKPPRINTDRRKYGRTF